MALRQFVDQDIPGPGRDYGRIEIASRWLAHHEEFEV